MAEERIRFRDIKPYDIVDSLDDLAGPAEGAVTLPVDVYWSGLRSTFDVADERERRVVYKAALSNGRREHIIEFVNRDLLLQSWGRLALDDRVIDLWRNAFPEIAAIQPLTNRAYPVIDPATGKETREW